MSLAVVRDLREARVPAGPEELLAFETDVLAGFVLARAAAGLSDDTIRSDVLHLEQLRAWFGRPLWDMQPADADAYFGTVLRDAAKGTRLARSQALRGGLPAPGRSLSSVRPDACSATPWEPAESEQNCI